MSLKNDLRSVGCTGITSYRGKAVEDCKILDGDIYELDGGIFLVSFSESGESRSRCISRAVVEDYIELRRINIIGNIHEVDEEQEKRKREGDKKRKRMKRTVTQEEKEAFRRQTECAISIGIMRDKFGYTGAWGGDEEFQNPNKQTT